MGGPAITENGEILKEADNFFEIPFTVDGIVFHSSEQCFQAMKATDRQDFDLIRLSPPGAAWTLGRRITLRTDWEQVKIDAMYRANREKFFQNAGAAAKLLATRGALEFRASTPFWNRWNALIVERIREELAERRSGVVSRRLRAIQTQMVAYRNDK